ncbi:hypothetical protein AB0420_21470 [Streptomyces caelestis]|uniref:MarR family transcriptional regulator n=1 Tax=Streptomyces heliomycini TaxID=284032 RepID=A0ABV5L3T6_9ACTN|nr:hypothetical protein [Streptomyces sp. XY152]
MGERQLVTRERAGDVTLTDTGRQALTTVHPGLDAAVRGRFTDKLSAREIETQSSVLRRLQPPEHDADKPPGRAITSP